MLTQVAPVPASRRAAIALILLAAAFLAGAPCRAQAGTDQTQTPAPQTPAPLERGIRPGEAAPGAVPGTSGTVAMPVNPDTGPHKINRVIMPDFADLVAQVRPAVVSITVKLRPGAGDEDQAGGQDEGNDDQGGPSQGPPQRRGRPTQARGSGFIIDADGTIVTNNHVVKDADSVTAQLDDGTELPARILGRDEATDLAVVKVDAGKQLPFLQLGDSSAVRVGEWVLAMGNPFGLGGTVTAGIVSAIGRNIGSGDYDEYIQIDAPINRGNSGGPTFAQDGKVIGVNTAILSPSGGSIGIGFAIPSNLVRVVVTQLQQTGHVVRGYLGVGAKPIDSAQAKGLGVAVNSGALIDTIWPASPAERAGLQKGDIITQVNGTPVANPRDLAVAVSSVKPGETAHFQVLRSGQTRSFDVTLAELPGGRAAERGGGPPHPGPRLGLQLGPLSPQARMQLNVPPGTGGAVIVHVEPGSPADKSGLRDGDVIIGVGSRPVIGPRDAIAAIREAMKEHAVALHVWRDGRATYVAVPLNDDQG
jgi:serine protease Do